MVAIKHYVGGGGNRVYVYRFPCNRPLTVLLLAGQSICEGHVAVPGIGAAAAFQLHQPAVFGDKGDGVRASEGVLHQTPALPGTAGSHGHRGKPGAVSPNVSPWVRNTNSHKLTTNSHNFIVLIDMCTNKCIQNYVINCSNGKMNKTGTFYCFWHFL